MPCTKPIDNLILKRKTNISNYLVNFFPKTLAKLISDYDYQFHGKSFTLIKSSLSTCNSLYHTKFFSHDGSVRCIVTLTDDRIISGSQDGIIKIWNLKNEGYEIDSIIGHNDWIICMAVFYDTIKSEYHLVTGSRDATLQVWKIGETIEYEFTLVAHTDSVLCIAVLPDDGQYPKIISGSCDSTLKIWTIDLINRCGKCDITLEGHTHHVTCVAVLPNPNDGCSRRIVSGSLSDELKIWTFKNNNVCVKNFPVYYENDLPSLSVMRCITVFSDEIIITGADDHNLKMWNINTEMCVDKIDEGHSTSVVCSIVLPDGHLLTGSGRTLRIWNMKTQKCDIVLPAHADWIRCVASLSDGRIVSGSKDGTIKIWC